MFVVCFFQAEDGIRDLVRSRGLGDVYKRQHEERPVVTGHGAQAGDGFDLRYAAAEQPHDSNGLSLIHI